MSLLTVNVAQTDCRLGRPQAICAQDSLTQQWLYPSLPVTGDFLGKKIKLQTSDVTGPWDYSLGKQFTHCSANWHVDSTVSATPVHCETMEMSRVLQQITCSSSFLIAHSFI